jgi:hypothetical protein
MTSGNDSLKWVKIDKRGKEHFSLSDEKINIRYNYCLTNHIKILQIRKKAQSLLSIKNLPCRRKTFPMRILLILLVLLYATCCTAQSGQKSLDTELINPGAAKLFEGKKSNLSIPERNAICKSLGIKYDITSGGFTEGENNEQIFPATAYPTDINKDGIEEVFVSYGNSYTSGATGSSIVLFIKNPAGKYEMQLGFPSTLPYALPTANKGYPDLLIGGPGFEFPVWRWNGKEYVFVKKMTEKDWLKLKSVNVEELSQAYQSTIK